MGSRGPCRGKDCIGGQQDLARVTDIQPRDGPKVDTWSKVDDSSVKSLRLFLQGIYPQMDITRGCAEERAHLFGAAALVRVRREGELVERLLDLGSGSALANAQDLHGGKEGHTV